MQGLEDNRFALINKTHHALVDGVSGVDLATVLFDMSPVPAERAGRTRRLDAGARADAGRADRRGRQGRDPRARATSRRGLLKAARDPAGDASRAAREAAEGIGEIVWAGLNPAPETPLNVPIGPHRRVWWARSLARRLQGDQERGRRDGQRRRAGRRVGRARALAAHARRAHRGARAARARPRLDPARRRARASSATRSPRCAARCPVYATDPLDRLEIVMEAMAHLKQSKQALGAEVISGLNDFAPPTLLAQASRLNFSTRLFNLIVTNVPGAAVPALPPGPRAAGAGAGRVPAGGPRAGGGDHELQRLRRLRPARRLRRDAGPRRVRGLHGGRARRADAGGGSREALGAGQ